MTGEKEDKTPTFEKALERLEIIANKMEEGESLDAMIRHFEEGSKLIKACNKQLHEIEQKIEKLVAQGDPEKTTPLDQETL